MCINFDGCEENIILFLKTCSPCLEGVSLLKDQVNIVNNDDILNCNPFEVTDSDVDGVNT